MKNKLVSFRNESLKNEWITWNYHLFETDIMEQWLNDSKEFYHVPNEFEKIFFEYQMIRLGKNDVTVDDIVNDILETLPPRIGWELYWRYLNHLAIYKIDVLINIVYKMNYNNPERIIEMLDTLVDHANKSSAPCFQVSVHFACKFFAKFYSPYSSVIQSIIEKENHQKEMNKYER